MISHFRSKFCALCFFFLFSFGQRKLPSPGFQVEVVLVDYDGTVPAKPETETVAKTSYGNSSTGPATAEDSKAQSSTTNQSSSQDKDDVFSDSEADETGSSKGRQPEASSEVRGASRSAASASETSTRPDEIASLAHGTEHVSLGNSEPMQAHAPSEPKSDAVVSDFKAMAADASVFTFGDEEDYESE